MLIPALIVSFALIQGGEDLTTGTRLYHSCQAASRFFDETSTNSSKEKVDRVAECLAYLNGFIDGINMGPHPTICMGEATAGTSIKVYLKYMDNHPTLLDKDRAVGLFGAFAETYPCKQK